MESIYRDHILEHARHPFNFGVLADATHTARLANPTCGDVCTIFLKIVDDRIVQAKFDGHGCALSTASASLLTEHLTEPTIAELWSQTKNRAELDRRLNESEFLTLLGIEPTSGRLDCALLPLRALHEALK